MNSGHAWNRDSTRKLGEDISNSVNDGANKRGDKSASTATDRVSRRGGATTREPSLSTRLFIHDTPSNYFFETAFEAVDAPRLDYKLGRRRCESSAQSFCIDDDDAHTSTCVHRALI